MAAPIERWARQAVDLERIGEYLTPTPPASAMQDIETLKDYELATWKRRERQLVRSGVPLAMPEGLYAATGAIPPVQTTTTTSINGNVNLWPNLVYTPIPVNGLMAPQIYRVMVCAKITTGATPGNAGWIPQINSSGTWTTGGTAISGGNSLGASGNVALTASITNAFYYIMGDLTIRASGTTGSAVGMFHLLSTQATSAGLAGPAAVGAGFNLLFGGTAVTPDFQTTAQSFQLAATHTVTTITHNIEQIHWCDWN